VYFLALAKGYSRHTDFTQVAQMKKERKKEIKKERTRENIVTILNLTLCFFTFEIGVVLIAVCIRLALMFF
jgi:hypothetical protein